MATLPDKLIVEFAEALGDKTKEQKRDSFVYGTVSSSNNDGVTVIFDGAEIATPVSTTVDVNVDDRVLMLIKNHTATVVSNVTSPSINGVTFTNFRDGVLASFDGITAKYADLGGFVSVANDTGCDSKTSANGGHRYKTSLYKHSTDGTYEYETGMKGDSSGQDPSQNLAFYVRQIPYGATWAEANVTSNFYVRNNGYLYAKNAKIKGEIEATTFYAKQGTLSMSLSADELEFNDTRFPSQWNAINGRGMSSFNGDTHYAQVSNGDVWTKNGDAYGRFSGNYIDVGFDDGDYNRHGRFVASASGNVGLYDVVNANYIIYSASDYTVHIPHPTALTSVQTYNGYYKPVGSYGTDDRRVSYLAARLDGSNYQFRVSGQWGDTGNNYSTKTIWSSSVSDIRLKENIRPTDVNGLDAINRMLMRQFDWKRTGDHQDIGFVADELEKIDPNLALGGGYDEDGNMDEKQVNTYQVVAYLVKAVQELSAEVEKLKGDRDDGR